MKRIASNFLKSKKYSYVGTENLTPRDICRLWPVYRKASQSFDDRLGFNEFVNEFGRNALNAFTLIEDFDKFLQDTAKTC